MSGAPSRPAPTCRPDSGPSLARETSKRGLTAFQDGSRRARETVGKRGARVVQRWGEGERVGRGRRSTYFFSSCTTKGHVNTGSAALRTAERAQLEVVLRRARPKDELDEVELAAGGRQGQKRRRRGSGRNGGRTARAAGPTCGGSCPPRPRSCLRAKRVQGRKSVSRKKPGLEARLDDGDDDDDDDDNDEEKRDALVQSTRSPMTGCSSISSRTARAPESLPIWAIWIERASEP